MHRSIAIALLGLVLTLGAAGLAQADDMAGTFTCTRTSLESSGTGSVDLTEYFEASYPVRVTAKGGDSYEVCDGDGFSDCDTVQVYNGVYTVDQWVNDEGIDIHMTGKAVYGNGAWNVDAQGVYTTMTVKAQYVCRQ